MAEFKWNVPESARKDTKYPDLTVYDHVALVVVDEELCDRAFRPVDEKNYCPEYNYCAELAFTALMQLGGQYVEQKHIDFMLKIVRDKADDGPNRAALNSIHDAVDYIFHKYKFEAWRQHVVMTQKWMQGSLEVTAIRDTLRGASDESVPKDSIGYVVGHVVSDKQYAIWWPWLKTTKYDNKSSVHPVADVLATGHRLGKHRPTERPARQIRTVV